MNLKHNTTSDPRGSIPLTPNRIHYPPTLETELSSLFRYQYSVDNVYSFFDYLFRQMYLTGDRWIEVPSVVVRDILGHEHHNILPKLKPYLNSSKSYSNWNHKCKSYTFKQSFIKELSHFNTWSNLNKFVKTISPTSNAGLVSGEEKMNSNSNSNSIINSNEFIPSIMLPSEGSSQQTTYTLDLEAFKLVSRQLYDPSLFSSKLSQQATIQTTKTLLQNILTDDLHETISEKNGRHYNEITQLMRDFRHCLIKNTEKFIGELDLKCCHGMIAANIFRQFMSENDFKGVFDLFKDPLLWSKLMEVTKIDVKEKVKAKFQLFMNGSLPQNTGNPIYAYFSVNYPRFTDILFKFKLDTNFSNAINKIESSVMHSPEVKAEMDRKGLNYDIVHDCLWLYGKGTEETNILHAAQYIIRMFKEKYKYDMVFTLEVINKPKVMVEAQAVEPYIDSILLPEPPRFKPVPVKNPFHMSWSWDMGYGSTFY